MTCEKEQETRTASLARSPLLRADGVRIIARRTSSTGPAKSFFDRPINSGAGLILTGSGGFVPANILVRKLGGLISLRAPLVKV